MRELFLILFVIAVLLALTAFRYRKQILAVYRVWSTLRSLQQNATQDKINPLAEPDESPLVNCARCGKWTSEATAIRLGTRSFYCSAACMEKAATAV
jgi:hypothetical protein